MIAKMKPIQGAETGGAVGFFKGVGKGLVGFVLTLHPTLIAAYNPVYDSAVTKPVVGVFDLASNVSEGTRACRWPCDTTLISTRNRHPKHYHRVRCTCPRTCSTASPHSSGWSAYSL